MALRILCYHEIMPAQAGQFAAHLAYFQKSGNRFTPLAAALENPGQDCVALTFDDGDRTVCEVAQPVLDGLGIKAMLYLTTDYVLQGSTYRARNPLPAASWEQLGRWLEAGHAIGGHTHTHRNLTECSREQALDELETSRGLIRQELGVEIAHFAYPWGRHDGQTRSWLEQGGGWATAATVEQGFNTAQTDRLRLRRDVLDPSMSLGAVRWKLAVGQSSLYRWQSGLRRAWRGLAQNR